MNKEYGKCVAKNDNYIREDIKELYDDFGEKAFIFTCRFIPNSSTKYATFSNFRIFDENDATKTKYQLTYHLNFPRSVVNQYFDSYDKSFRRMKFFVVGYPTFYIHYGVKRYAIKLVTGYSIPPIVRAPVIETKWKENLKKMIELKSIFNDINN